MLGVKGPKEQRNLQMPCEVMTILILLMTSSGLANAADDRATPSGAKGSASALEKEAGVARVLIRVTAELRQRDLLQWSDELAGNLATADPETLMVAVEVFCRASP
jgi:hypothetical protein